MERRSATHVERTWKSIWTQEEIRMISSQSNTCTCRSRLRLEVIGKCTWKCSTAITIKTPTSSCKSSTKTEESPVIQEPLILIRTLSPRHTSTQLEKELMKMRGNSSPKSELLSITRKLSALSDIDIHFISQFIPLSQSPNNNNNLDFNQLIYCF